MSTPSTAARSTANLDRHYATIMEEWDPGFEDFVFEENAFWWILNALQKRWKTGGRDYVQLGTSQTNSTAKAFEGIDPLTPQAEQGPSAALWAMKNYIVTMQEIWQEAIENSGDFAVADRFKEMVEKAELSLADLLDSAGKEGQGNGTKHIEGLENAVFYKSPNTPTTLLLRGTNSATAGHAFIANNTYAGVARSGTDAMATGWRNLSGDLTGSGVFSSSSNSYKQLQRSINLLNRGRRGIDLILMSNAPFEDFCRVHEGLVKFEKGLGGEAGMAQLPFSGVKFNDALVVRWENATNSGLNSNDGNASDAMIYLLNTSTWKLVCETQAWFAMTDWYWPGTVMSRLAHLVTRFALVCQNPRYNGVLGEYGE